MKCAIIRLQTHHQSAQKSKLRTIIKSPHRHELPLSVAAEKLFNVQKKFFKKIMLGLVSMITIEPQ